MVPMVKTEWLNIVVAIAMQWVMAFGRVAKKQVQQRQRVEKMEQTNQSVGTIRII